MLETADLHSALVSLTIGGQSEPVLPEAAARIFGEYLCKALPGIEIVSIIPLQTSAALNSVAANVRFKHQGRDYDSFAKVHIESNRSENSISSAAGMREYEGAELLEESGWPVVRPIELPFNKDYPVLFYPKVDAPTLFQLLEESYSEDVNKITRMQFDALRVFEQRVGQAAVQSVKTVPAQQARDEQHAPAQSLFASRLASGGRIDQWYRPATEIYLPGLDSPIPWHDLSHSKWRVNGRDYRHSIAELVANAKRMLSFEGETEAVVCVAHGDDHAGNIFVPSNGTSATVFDPAVAGYSPAALAHVKAFMHSGVLPIAGLYYDPKLEFCNYRRVDGVLEASISFERSARLQQHVEIAKNISDLRFVPLFNSLSLMGVDTNREIERMKAAMITCCLLVINVATLLSRPSQGARKFLGGTGQGLLPMIPLCSELNGLPQFDYLRERLEGFVVKGT